MLCIGSLVIRHSLIPISRICITYIRDEWSNVSLLELSTIGVPFWQSKLCNANRNVCPIECDSMRSAIPFELCRIHVFSIAHNSSYKSRWMHMHSTSAEMVIEPSFARCNECALFIYITALDGCSVVRMQIVLSLQKLSKLFCRTSTAAVR